MKKRIRILSIDGGGIRGIIPAVILNELEARLQAKSGTDQRLAEYFDFMAGTSTGGILVCGYLCPDSNGRPEHPATTLRDLYLDHGGDIFDISLKQKVRSLGGLTDEKYDNAALRKVIRDTVGDTMLKDLLLPCLIPAYDIEKRRAVMFNQDDAHKPRRNFLVRDVALATTAAPTYFETAQIQAEEGGKLALIDGGVFANNPAMCAYAEVRQTNFGRTTGDKKKWNRPRSGNMMMLSIGCGELKQSYDYKAAKDWGLAGWAQPIMDILQGGNSETVSYQLKLLFEASKSEDFYHRWEPALGKACGDLDDAEPKNLEALKAAGEAFIAQNSAQIDLVVEQLLDNE